MKTKLLKAIRSKYYITYNSTTGYYRLTNKDYTNTHLIDNSYDGWIKFIIKYIPYKPFFFQNWYFAAIREVRWKRLVKFKYLSSLRIEQYLKQLKINEAIHSTPTTC
jgi:hypothetical protein